MSAPVRTVPWNTPVSQVAREMAHERIGALPVLDGSGRMSGLASVRDVLAHCARVLE